MQVPRSDANSCGGGDGVDGARVPGRCGGGAPCGALYARREPDAAHRGPDGQCEASGVQPISKGLRQAGARRRRDGGDGGSGHGGARPLRIRRACVHLTPYVSPMHLPCISQVELDLFASEVHACYSPPMYLPCISQVELDLFASEGFEEVRPAELGQISSHVLSACIRPPPIYRWASRR